MDHRPLAFLGIAAPLIITPGVDMALVTKNALRHGQNTAVFTALGVNAGLLVWTVAAALGVAGILRASATAFTAMTVAWLTGYATFASKTGDLLRRPQVKGERTALNTVPLVPGALEHLHHSVSSRSHSANRSESLRCSG